MGDPPSPLGLSRKCRETPGAERKEDLLICPPSPSPWTPLARASLWPPCGLPKPGLSHTGAASLVCKDWLLEQGCPWVSQPRVGLVYRLPRVACVVDRTECRGGCSAVAPSTPYLHPSLPGGGQRPTVSPRSGCSRPLEQANGPAKGAAGQRPWGSPEAVPCNRKLQ